MRLLTFITVQVIALFFLQGNALAAPAIQNEAVVYGTVKEFSITLADTKQGGSVQTLYKLAIAVDRTETAGSSPNFVKSKNIQLLTAYSKKKQPAELFGKRVKAHVSFRGDERGGLFWIRKIETMDDERGGVHE